MTMETGTTIKVSVQKPTKGSPSGLGLKAQAGSVVVSRINSDSVFCHTKLQVGMAIVRVNGRSCVHESASFVAQQLKAAGGGMVTVEARQLSELETMEAGHITESPQAVEDRFPFTTVVLQKETKDMLTGLRIASKTTQDGKVFPIVGTIRPGSLASATKLKSGMRLLTLNGIPCRTKEDTAQRLNNATGKVQIRAGSHKMIMVSAPKPTTGNKFGIRLAKQDNGQQQHVIVTGLDKNGSFYDTGLEVGMKVLKMNGKNVGTMEMKDVLGILSNCKNKVMILAESLPPPAKSVAMPTPGVPPGVEPGGQWGTGKFQGPCNSLVFCIIFPISCCLGGLTLCFKMDRKAMYLSLDGNLYDVDGGLQGRGSDAALGFRPNPLGARDAPQEVPKSTAEQCCGSGAETRLYAMGVCLAMFFWILYFTLQVVVITLEPQ